MAYVLGFMFADGSLVDSNASSRTYYLSFTNNDLDLLTQIKDALSSNHKIYTRAPRVMFHKNCKYVSKRGYVLRIGNKEMYNDLIMLGLGHRKSNTMNFPNVPSDYFSFFLRGYFDGDGCVSFYLGPTRHVYALRVAFTSGSIAFLNDLSATLGTRLGIYSVRAYVTRGAYNLVFRGLGALTILDFIYLHENKAPFLKYKYEKYLHFKDDLMGPRLRASLVRRDRDRQQFLGVT